MHACYKESIYIPDTSFSDSKSFRFSLSVSSEKRGKLIRGLFLFLGFVTDASSLPKESASDITKSGVLAPCIEGKGGIIRITSMI